ncbi:MAG TPA: hypothetical protein VMH31_11970 [Methylomirabilota bacterium]|nr:hypothetical protein [Methylomirabilota bacterium]
MKIVLALKPLAELYLIIVGGAYSLAGFVAVIANTRLLLMATDRTELRDSRADVGTSLIMLAFAALALTAGIGILKFRRWGLALAAIAGVCGILEALSASTIDPWEYHNFTIALPLVLIMIWAMLPPTWVAFSERRLKST